MTPAQCQAARAILKLEVRDLADAANVSTSAIMRLERGEDLLARTVNAVRAALDCYFQSYLLKISWNAFFAK